MTVDYANAPIQAAEQRLVELCLAAQAAKRAVERLRAHPSPHVMARAQMASLTCERILAMSQAATNTLVPPPPVMTLEPLVADR